MRFNPRKPFKKIQLNYDVVISQNFGRQIDSYRARTMPNGGSELHTVVVAEGLRRAGLRVAVIQPGPHFVRWAGVDYLSLEDVIHRGLYDIQCEVLVSQRFGSLPSNVSFARLAVEMHDLPDERCHNVMGFMAEVPGCKTIVHSKFNAELYPDWPGLTIIPAMIDDSLFDLPAVQRPRSRERVLVYGSAALKGLAPTLQLWRELHKNKYTFKKSKLIVTSPGYDDAMQVLEEWSGRKRGDVVNGDWGSGVHYEQQRTVGDMQRRLQNSDGIFMCNVLCETYGVVQTQCEIAGRPAWVMCLNGPGALRETLANPDTVFTDPEKFVNAVCAVQWPEMKPAKDVRQSTVIPLWLDCLGLKSKKSEAA